MRNFLRSLGVRIIVFARVDTRIQSHLARPVDFSRGRTPIARTSQPSPPRPPAVLSSPLRRKFTRITWFGWLTIYLPFPFIATPDPEYNHHHPRHRPLCSATLDNHPLDTRFSAFGTQGILRWTLLLCCQIPCRPVRLVSGGHGERC